MDILGQREQDVYVKQYAPLDILSYFKHKGQSQGHRFIDCGVIIEIIITGVCIPNIKSVSLK